MTGLQEMILIGEIVLQSKIAQRAAARLGLLMTILIISKLGAQFNLFL